MLPRNVNFMLVTLRERKTTKKQISLTNSQQKNNEITVPLDTNHLDRSWLKALAVRNALSMFTTLDVVQADTSPLNKEAPRKMDSMVVTRLTFHADTSFCHCPKKYKYC